MEGMQNPLDDKFLAGLRYSVGDLYRLLKVPLSFNEKDRTLGEAGDFSTWRVWVTALYQRGQISERFNKTFKLKGLLGRIDAGFFQAYRQLYYEILNGEWSGGHFDDFINRRERYGNKFKTSIRGQRDFFEWTTKRAPSHNPNLTEKGYAEWCAAARPDQFDIHLVDLDVLKEFRKSWEKDYLNAWFSDDQLLDECMRVLARLTEKPDGALVSLWDLLDERDFHRFIILREIFAWTAQKVPPPIPYNPDTAFFTKTTGTFAVIQNLLQAFQEWEKSPEKK